MRRLSVAIYLLAQTAQGQFTPPGTIKIDSVYVDASEITNLNYIEYLHDLKGRSATKYLNALPDTTVWSDIYDEPLASAFTYDYLRGEEFRYFPVVGLSRQQAKDYCEWRSAVVNQKIDSATSFKVRYYLPSPDEWYSVAIASTSYKISSNSVDLSKMRFQRSYLKEIKDRSNAELTLKNLKKQLIRFYERNPILLFENLSVSEEFKFKDYLGVGGGPKRSLPGNSINDIRGNVSELTREPGTAMGGNWTLTFEETSPETRYIYENPSAMIGFRCFCTLKTQ
ncbi:MAG: SUMF1/EgtB/PvdO family nonheme iron enzyme [Bacteroidota bacterium]